ncbi:MAG: hypothetical protein JNL01_14585 [Bdellovibrionales bacterium]|nr:hypothetical protein [Bdellovibrionales bacterium]
MNSPSRFASWIRFSLVLLAFLTALSCSRRISAPREVSAQEAQGLLQNQFAVLIDLKMPGTPPTQGLPAARLFLNHALVDSPEERQKFVKGIPEKYSLLLTGGPAAKLSELADQISKLGRQADWITPAADTPSAKKLAPRGK